MSELNIISTNGLVRLQLNRPAVLNALSPTLLNAIIDACDDIGQDESIRVVVLEGAGQHFSAGADLPAFHKDLVSDPLPTADLGRRATEAIAALPQIAIAAIASAERWYSPPLAMSASRPMTAASSFRNSTRAYRWPGVVWRTWSDWLAKLWRPTWY